ncbi:GNAT family N-acetyltransferase [Microbulbifer taiwanensis]|uniref:GNAT family N-acetyltransferase n=1 Tax=Microbulbifer taiwanensis TaxID=986746 RepID=A0ABW1YKZ5_9GAMM|nr:GNAT family N-acetyltransferase [Microbulbifer taiwanensis]
MSQKDPVTIYYLQMTSPEQIRGKPRPEGLEVMEAEVKEFRFNRYLYQLVGEAWQWADRLKLPDADWQRYAEREQLRTWVAYHRGSIAGYYELEQQAGGDVQIAYFGLAPKFIGRGYGGYLLTHALESAWSWGDTKEVWVHTCTLDHPGALDNYRARGMEVYRTERE